MLAAVPLAAWPEKRRKAPRGAEERPRFLRNVALDLGGKGLVALLVDAAKKRTEIVRLSESGVVKRFGRFAEQPPERRQPRGRRAGGRSEPPGQHLGGHRAWGPASVFRLNQDGSPFEESVIGAKGALEKSSGPTASSSARSACSTRTMDLALAEADATPVVLASYRNVSQYHGVRFREGIMLVAAATQCGSATQDARRSVCVDSAGRVWIADVAGHVACYSLKGLNTGRGRIAGPGQSPTRGSPPAPRCRWCCGQRQRGRSPACSPWPGSSLPWMPTACCRASRSPWANGPAGCPAPGDHAARADDDFGKAVRACRKHRGTRLPPWHLQGEYFEEYLL